MRYYLQIVMRSFANDETERVFRRLAGKRFSIDLQRNAYRKLLLLDAAESISDLRIPPGNRLEKLKANRQGQYSIRINSQWRICFIWKDGDAYEVEITDYHS
jgi:proteic killer suppression protein